MDNKPFAHLHVHTEYSLLDGSSKIKELVSQTKKLGMDAIAITDHGVMFGVVDFYKAAVAEGIHPVLGCEIYVASGSRFNKESGRDNFYYHLVLLAESIEGYQNLVKLVSYGFIEGFYYKPRVDIELLKKYSSGLIALSACLAGPVAKNILQSGYDRAKEEALLYNEIFGQGNFYLELQDHGIPDQKLVNSQILKMAKETGIPMVCTNDLHYIYQEDAKAHDVLLCIQTGKTVMDEDRMRYEGDQFYLKSPEEMYTLFPYAVEALENTQAIAKRCQVDFEFNQYKLPIFPLPAQTNPADYLRKICENGLKERYPQVTEELKARLDYEFNVIESMGFVDYFLVVWDFIKFARDNDISVGPGRGSAAGSLVAYSLGITNIDPLKYNLLFERFLNPERISMPDIDIDFCYERRQEVIDYVIEKYGADHVAQIITFGTMAARGSIRDVGRALGHTYGDVDKIAKMVPFAIGMTISKALNMNPELKKAYDEDSGTKEIIDMSLRLEGLPRHSSTHAAGVVICDRPVMDYVPLNQNDGVITTQFPMNTLEELGLLKMDFLGLRTLTVIRNAVDEIKRNHGVTIDIDEIPFDDAKVYQLISQGRTEGVFQLESAGMKSFMKDLQPANMEDIIAGISLYRPGPMDFIPKYVKGKKYPETITYTHPALEEILQPTYGCIVYQEQVMQIVRDLAGYSLGRSDLVRRAMSKKKADVMQKERMNFIFGSPEDGVPGCIANGIPQEAAEKIFDEMTDFAKYAFNKSHAAAYAVIGYQTGWLKVYYPVEFMAALLTSVMDASGKIAEYIHECKKMNIDVLPPDINEGFGHFSVSKGSIRFGLLAIKNVGYNATVAVVRERDENGPYTSLTDFIHRMKGNDINKRSLESMIKAGAFDSLGGTRAQYMEIYKQVMDGVDQAQKHTMDGQMNLFEMEVTTKEELFQDILPDMGEWPEREKLDKEKEVLGIYVSGHPLSGFLPVLERHVSGSSLHLIRLDEGDELEGNDMFADGEAVAIGGMVERVSVKYTKNNQAMAFLTLEDLYGNIEVILFPQVYAKYMGRLETGAVLVVHGRVSIREEEDGKVIANDIRFYEELAGKGKEKSLWLKLPDQKGDLSPVMDILLTYHGNIPVKLYHPATNKRTLTDKRYWVREADGLLAELKSLLGEQSVILKEG